jgi:hypothetical protein
MARIETRRRMRRLIGLWRRSGRTKAEFVRRHGVTRGKFEYWVRRVDGEVAAGRRGRREALSFVPVQVSGAAIEDAPAPIEIVLANGDRLRVRADVPLDALRQVVSILRQGC